MTKVPRIDLSWFWDIPGFEGRYAIDVSGNVYSYRKEALLKPGTASNGYLTVALGSGNTRCIHELILTTFTGPRPSSGHVSRHLDGNKLNNSIFNLSWATYSRNGQDKKWHGQHRKLTTDKVKEIKMLLDAGEISRAKIGKLYGVVPDTIQSIHTGRTHGDVM